jgi:hypothetical protein
MGVNFSAEEDDDQQVVDVHEDATVNDVMVAKDEDGSRIILAKNSSSLVQFVRMLETVNGMRAGILVTSVNDEADDSDEIATYDADVLTSEPENDGEDYSTNSVVIDLEASGSRARSPRSHRGETREERRSPKDKEKESEDRGFSRLSSPILYDLYLLYRSVKGFDSLLIKSMKSQIDAQKRVSGRSYHGSYNEKTGIPIISETQLERFHSSVTENNAKLTAIAMRQEVIIAQSKMLCDAILNNYEVEKPRDEEPDHSHSDGQDRGGDRDREYDSSACPVNERVFKNAERIKNQIEELEEISKAIIWEDKPTEESVDSS